MRKDSAGAQRQPLFHCHSEATRGKATPTAGRGQPRKSPFLTRRPFIFSDSVPGHSSWLRERMQTGKTHSFGRKPSLPPSLPLSLSSGGCGGCPLSSPWLPPAPPPLCVGLFQERGFCGFSHRCVLSSENPPVGTQQGFSRSLLKEETKEAWSLCSGPGLSESTTE